VTIAAASGGRPRTFTDGLFQARSAAALAALSAKLS